MEVGSQLTFFTFLMCSTCMQTCHVLTQLRYSSLLEIIISVKGYVWSTYKVAGSYCNNLLHTLRIMVVTWPDPIPHRTLCGRGSGHTRLASWLALLSLHEHFSRLWLHLLAYIEYGLPQVIQMLVLINVQLCWYLQWQLYSRALELKVTSGIISFVFIC